MHIDRPIAIALIIFVIILLIFFLVMPEYNNFKSLQTTLGEKRAEYAAEYDYYSAIDATYINLQNHQDDVQKIDNALPQNSDLGNIIFYLQRTARSNGLTVKDVFSSKSTYASYTSGTSDTTSNVHDISFSMDLSGDYPALENFIVSLERSSRIFEINNISFDSSSSPPYNFNLQIKTHSY